MFLSLVLLAQKQASTDLSLLLRNSLACFWFVDTCHNICYIFLSWAKYSTKPGVDYGEFKPFFPFLVEVFGHLGYILSGMNARPRVSK